MTPEARIAELEAELHPQREHIERLLSVNVALQARVQELEARLAKDSHNSRKPPSSDGLRRTTKSLRQKSGKKAGGQLGHRGETLHLVASPDAVVEHRPAACAQCGTALPNGEAVVARERRQVHELPPLRLVVTEHQGLPVRCPACQHVSAGTFPADAPSRVQYGPRLRALAVYLVEAHFVPFGRTQQRLSDLLGVQLARGTVVGWVQQAARTLAPVETAIKAALVRAPVLPHDETGGVEADDWPGRMWPAPTGGRTMPSTLSAGRRRPTPSASCPPRAACVGMTGGSGYRAYPACRHALCNVHHLRELTFLEEEDQQAWAGDLKDLLRQMRTAADQAREQGARQVPPAQRDPLLARYRDLLATGLAANPPPAARRRPGQRGRLKQSPARHLLERRLLGQEQVLAVLDDLAIPFDTNQAERDLRGLKVPQKVSGGFRSDVGADAFACLRGYVATMRKQGQALLAALQTVFAGPLLYPAFA
jgi:transposase